MMAQKIQATKASHRLLLQYTNAKTNKSKSLYTQHLLFHLKRTESIYVLWMFEQNFYKSISNNHFIIKPIYSCKPGLLKGAKCFSIRGVSAGLGYIVVVSFTIVGGTYCSWGSGVMSHGTSGLLVVRCGVISLVGLGEAVSIRVGCYWIFVEGWRLFLSVILSEPSEQAEQVLFCNMFATF